jgi:Ca-activated chloride channel family protein
LRRSSWALALALSGGLGSGPATAASLRVTSPPPDTPISGPTRLRAELEPEELGAQVTRLTLSVDGEIACSLEKPPFECAWDAGAGIVPHHLRAVATLRSGARLVASVRTAGVDLSLAVDVNLVQVTAIVTDSKGRLLRGLKPDDFHVFEDGAPQPVSHFLGEDAQREIVVAVDMSGSMAPAMPRVRRAVQGFLGALKAEDRVTLIAFNDGIFTLARRESEPGARVRAVDRLAAWGGTALYDVILKGYETLDPRKGKKALVVFTDGEDESSRATIQDVERRVERSDTPLYMIGQGRGTKDPTLKNILGRLARMGGGRAFHTDDPAELPGVFAGILDELSGQYVLAYSGTNTRLDGGWRTIRVEVGAGRLVRARQGYRAGERSK